MSDTRKVCSSDSVKHQTIVDAVNEAAGFFPAEPGQVGSTGPRPSDWDGMVNIRMNHGAVIRVQREIAVARIYDGLATLVTE